MIKEIPNMEPFNDVFYRTCFYNSLIPIIKSFNRDIIPYFIWEFPYYRLTNKGKMPLLVDYHTEKSIIEILQSQNIKLITKEVSDDICNDIIRAIDNNHPVIIWVDTFHTPYRTDTYEKVHWPHSLLIYGYNLLEETFSIIEHHHADSLTYNKVKIDSEDLVRAYKGYIDTIKQSNENTFFEFENNGSECPSFINSQNYLIDYVNLIKKNQKKLVEGLGKVWHFKEYIEHVSKDKNKAIAYSSMILESLIDIVNAKKAEMYKFEILGLDLDKMRLMKQIIDSWSLIRAIIAKIHFSGKINSDHIKELLHRLDKVVEKEEEFHINL
ncbi:hypothetical protein COM13_19000 [Bacillus pseudomycoides]|uniref:BtrH N-terminal domain-containing protein n=1 Tax=Bacillus TaxID=1386 RepID=UPI000381F913|nr:MULTISPECIES: BtrH N-terminal domain-containing protein [Bacillus]PDX99239.1 hypothetical protein COO07_17610 [Bacillus pseudomycoides]PEK80753.1 hypothetical protein CN597_10090 [Bacillus pseudomycoides]PEN08103.1 hypothetical protein CN640_13795 [Bacillus pseudomycoides]PGB87554.1 hypothetical protein COM13_19000 [Bacillus pseudomycoides]PGS04518.1 hypothetical protein COC54_12580 [Bacillus pseudomycoides]